MKYLPPLILVLVAAVLWLLVDIRHQLTETRIMPKHEAPQEYVETIGPDGERRVCYLDGGMTVEEVMAAMQGGGLVLVNRDCWMSDGTQVTVVTVQQPGETKEEKEARHAARVAAIMAIYPKTGECP